MPIVQFENLSYCTSGSWLLRDIEWTIEPDQHWALLGANGSGKTTLLKILTGYLWATTGSVSVLDRRYGECDLRQLRKRIGWVSASLQHRMPEWLPAIDVALSGYDASFGVYREFSAEERRHAQASLAHFGMESFADRTFGTLSQGEQQRALIARALVNEPAVLVLDEPCAGLDPAARELLLSDLGKFAGSENAPTLILVTHHVEEIGPWITHGLVLKGGRVLVSDCIERVFASSVFSEMLGRPAEIVHEDGQHRLKLSGAARPPERSRNP